MRWSWIDRILELTPGERLVAIKHICLGEEAIRDHFSMDDGLGPDNPVMPASLIIEGMAQTAGVLVGHAGGFKEKVVLAKISRVELTREATPGATLRFTATIERLDAAGASTSGIVELLNPHPCVEHAAGISPASCDPAHREHELTAEVIGRIDLIFSHLDNNFAGVSFPDHNFVFSDSFRTLLRVSGMEVTF